MALVSNYKNLCCNSSVSASRSFWYHLIHNRCLQNYRICWSTWSKQHMCFKYRLCLLCMPAWVLSHLTLCDPVDHSQPHSSVHGILQKRTLEWVAISAFRKSSRPKNWTHVSISPALAGGFYTTSTIEEAPLKLTSSVSPSKGVNTIFCCRK